MAAEPINPAVLRPPGVVGPPEAPARPARPVRPPTGPSFAEVLAERQAPGVSFSGHALQRVERRGIDLSPQTLARLGDGVDRAAAKGARSSVVLVDDVAFVVGVPSRTVVTAVDRGSLRSHVFTNIDSAVIA